MNNNEIIINLVPISLNREEITLKDLNSESFNVEVENVVMQNDKVNIIFKHDITSINSCKFFNSQDLEIDSIEFPQSFDTVENRTHLSRLIRQGIKVNKGNELIIEDGVLVYAPDIAGEIVIPEGVVVIGEKVFWESRVTNVVLPASLERIEANAFAKTKLQSVQLPENLKYIGESAFESVLLEEIAIPDSVVTIDNHAFYKCEGLKSVTVGKGLEEIGNGVFAQCSNLSKFKGKYVSEKGKIIVKDNVLLAVAGRFRKLNIPEGIEEIAPDVFDFHSLWVNNPANVVVTLPSTIKKIGNKAFYNTEISVENPFPEKLETIGSRAFSGTNLTEVSLPESVCNISEEAFRGCPKLRNFSGKFATRDGKYLVVDGVLVATIAKDPTLGLHIPKNVTVIGAGTFDALKNVEVKLHKGITDINDWAFSNCKFTSIKFPETLKKIGINAFFQAKFPGDLILPEGLEILDGAFYNATIAGKEIKLPSTLKLIDNNALMLKEAEDDEDPKTMIFKSLVPPAITVPVKYEYWCKHFSARIIRIPKAAKDAYLETNWLKCLSTCLKDDLQIIYY